jgi:hypothetical protein
MEQRRLGFGGKRRLEDSHRRCDLGERLLALERSLIREHLDGDERVRFSETVR